MSYMAIRLIHAVGWGVHLWSGVGKSSWVNAVRRVSSPNDPDFAELCVDGPTMEPHSYRFPAQNLNSISQLSQRVTGGFLLKVIFARLQRP